MQCGWGKNTHLGMPSKCSRGTLSYVQCRLVTVLKARGGVYLLLTACRHIEDSTRLVTVNKLHNVHMVNSAK